jgi:hypothetical protein
MIHTFLSRKTLDIFDQEELQHLRKNGRARAVRHAHVHFKALYEGL